MIQERLCTSGRLWAGAGALSLRSLGISFLSFSLRCGEPFLPFLKTEASMRYANDSACLGYGLFDGYFWPRRERLCHLGAFEAVQSLDFSVQVRKKAFAHLVSAYKYQETVKTLEGRHLCKICLPICARKVPLLWVGWRRGEALFIFSPGSLTEQRQQA